MANPHKLNVEKYENINGLTKILEIMALFCLFLNHFME